MVRTFRRKRSHKRRKRVFKSTERNHDFMYRQAQGNYAYRFNVLQFTHLVLYVSETGIVLE
jgi:hypothetical protein